MGQGPGSLPPRSALGPERLQIRARLGSQLEKRFELGAGIIAAGGAVRHPPFRPAGPDLALPAVGALAAAARTAVAHHALEGDVRSVVLLPPLDDDLLQRLLVAGLSGDVGRAVGTNKPAIGDDFTHNDLLDARIPALELFYGIEMNLH